MLEGCLQSSIWNLILGIENESLEIYTSRRELMFNHFLYVNVVRNIRGCSDLSDDICQLSFRNRLPPCCSIITRILRHFILPLYKSVYKESEKLGGETISTIGFHKRNEEWVKTTSIKNQDTLVAPEDDRVLNDVYSANQLLDFWLGARAQDPKLHVATQPPIEPDFRDHKINIGEHLVP